MLRKNSQGSWGMKWLEGVDKTHDPQRTWHFPGIPERLKIVVGGFHFNDSGTMP